MTIGEITILYGLSFTCCLSAHPVSRAYHCTRENDPVVVTINNLKVYHKTHGIEIEWTNLSEKDIANYAVERSAEGHSFVSIAIKTPFSNRGGRADYDFFDEHPLQYLNFYRIRVQETSGTITYSEVLNIKSSEAKAAVKIYPNPVTNHTFVLSIKHAKLGKYNLEIFNAGGQMVYHNELNIQDQSQTQTINLPSSMLPGAYFLVISNKKGKITKKLIIQ